MYAILEDGKVSKAGSLTELFPSVSFAAAGPDQEWLTLNNVTEVQMTLDYNEDTEELVYLETPKILKGNKSLKINIYIWVLTFLYYLSGKNLRIFINFVYSFKKKNILLYPPV